MGLIHAVKEGDLEGVKQCIAQGADANEVDEQGFSALHHAVLVENPDILTLLLGIEGINPNLQTNAMKQTPIMLAISQKQSGLAGKIADAPNFDPNIRDVDGFTSLNYAAWNNDLGLIQNLVEKGGDVKCESNDHSTLLHSTAVGITQAKFDWELMKWLIKECGLDFAKKNDDADSVEDFLSNKDPGYVTEFNKILGELGIIGDSIVPNS